MLNINADIVPSKSAAGFFIGDKFDEIVEGLGVVAKWTRERALSADIASNHALQVELSQISNIPQHGRLLFLENGKVELHFNREGILFYIGVHKGYKGSLFNNIFVGSKLADVNEMFELKFDGGDEMYYPAKMDVVPGVSFYAADQLLHDDEAQIIQIIAVHDWALRGNE